MGLTTKTGRLPSFRGQLVAQVPTPTFSGLLTSNASDSINPYTSVGPAEGGGGQTYDEVYNPPSVDPNIALLLNFEGTNGATSTTDASSNNYPITFNGAAQISTAVKKFGNSSLYIPSAGDIRFSPNVVNVGSSNFTWEAWIYPTSTSGDRGIFTGRQGAGFSTLIFRILNGQLGLLVDTGSSGNWDILAQSAGAVSANTWSHVAVERTGTNIATYLNGTRTTNSNISTNSISNSIPGNGCIGSDNSADFSPFFVGYIDSVRMTNGESVYQNAATITVPTEAF